MGNRLSKIYTRTGDAGTTGLADGSRIGKDELRVEVMGDVDELNCALGMALVSDVRDTIRELLSEVQQRLFDLGGELALPGASVLNEDHVRALEQALDDFNDGLPSLREFVLPGGGHAASACHLARAICRRAERRAFALARAEAVNAHTLAYLNRLSDLLFVLCRILARDEGGLEVLWRHERQVDEGQA